VGRQAFCGEEIFEVAGRLFMPDSYLSGAIPTLPGHTFSIGIGETFDVRPTVSLVAEVIPTPVNGEPLGMHRFAYAFGVKKEDLSLRVFSRLHERPVTTVF
jgi:hypothetical protein